MWYDEKALERRNPELGVSVKWFCELQDRALSVRHISHITSAVRTLSVGEAERQNSRLYQVAREENKIDERSRSRIFISACQSTWLHGCSNSFYGRSQVSPWQRDPLTPLGDFNSKKYTRSPKVGYNSIRSSTDEQDMSHISCSVTSCWVIWRTVFKLNVNIKFELSATLCYGGMSWTNRR